MEKHVYLVRHGQSDSNVDGVYRGRDAVLTDTGREQARIVAERIERIGVKALITSKFPRAVTHGGFFKMLVGSMIFREEFSKERAIL